MTYGYLCPIGYAQPNADEVLEAAMTDPATRIVDVRFSPKSRWRTEWNMEALHKKYRDRYTWEQGLGNRNYHDPNLPIVIVDRRRVSTITTLLRAGNNVLIICACKDFQKCHRRVVVELVQTILPEVEVVLP